MIFLWPPYLIGQAIHYIFALWFLSFCQSFYLFPRLISAATDWMSTILLHMAWPCANLECRSEMCCTRLAANTGRKKSPKITICAPSHNFLPGVTFTLCPSLALSYFGSVTARHSSSRRQPNFVALNEGRHLYSAGRPSRWALAQSVMIFCHCRSYRSQQIQIGSCKSYLVKRNTMEKGNFCG